MSHNLESIQFLSCLGGDTGKGDAKHLQNSTRQWGGWDRITRTLNDNSTHANSTHTQGKRKTMKKKHKNEAFGLILKALNNNKV